MKRSIALCLTLITVASCRDGTTGPSYAPHFTNALPPAGERGITVMTRNIYLGADIDAFFSAPPEQIPILAAQKFGEIVATNFPERAGALAAEIAAARPQLVGLQEVSLYRRQSPGDLVLGGTTPATTVVFDFLQLLLDSLAARGETYAPVAINAGFDAELPMFTGVGPSGPTFDDIRMTDRDVILARGDVTVSDARHANYTVNLTAPVGGVPLTVVRGWTSVVAAVAGNELRFVNTHLETQGAAPIQAFQVNELLGLVAGETRPTILVGDFNSAADGSQTPTYGTIASAGFVDSWSQAHPSDPGYSCCQAANLLNPVSQLSQRLDIVFFRDGFSAQSGRITGGVHVDIVGEAPADRTASGLWPSDHAGMVASFALPPAVARR